jgi:serine/threonine-protein kinase
MILKYYPDGSLHNFLFSRELGQISMVKVMNEVALALSTMHSNFLAHRDIKTQNVLIEVENGIPSCYLTDFGIAQILSEKVIATKTFNVINLKGLSTQYASPEAFGNFRSKIYRSVDFKKYDIYSLGCVFDEVLTRTMPWN